MRKLKKTAAVFSIVVFCFTLSVSLPDRVCASERIGFSSVTPLPGIVSREGSCYKVVPNGNFVSGSTPWKHLLEYTFENGELNTDKQVCVRIKIKLTDKSSGYAKQTLSLMCKDTRTSMARNVFSEYIDDTAIGEWQCFEFYFTPGENNTVPAKNAYMIYFCIGTTEELYTPDRYYYLSEAEFETVGGLDVAFLKRDADSAAVLVENHTEADIPFKGVIIIARYDSAGNLEKTVAAEPISETIVAREGFVSKSVKIGSAVSGDRIMVFLSESIDSMKPLKEKLDEYIN